jgi:hypothetical protein
MTPELKKACELIFQEHKCSSQPIKWNSETFKGRISLGLADLGREVLLEKKILSLPDKSKKMTTRLNPAIASAGSVEEAEAMLASRSAVMTTAVVEEKRVLVATPPSTSPKPAPRYTHRLVEVQREEPAGVAELRWYMRPVFFYVLWPLCAIAGGIGLTYLIDLVYTQLFLH